MAAGGIFRSMITINSTGRQWPLWPCIRLEYRPALNRAFGTLSKSGRLLSSPKSGPEDYDKDKKFQTAQEHHRRKDQFAGPVKMGIMFAFTDNSQAGPDPVDCRSDSTSPQSISLS